MVREPVKLVAGHGGGEVAFDVDGGVVGDVEHDFDDGAVGELEGWAVVGGDGVTAVVADAESFPAE